tara:strand:+ start:69 stop:290 length:222 start_codon:yes stop_codon:yes gene_type:complete
VGAVELGQWADTVRHKGGTEYVRADLLDDAVKALERALDWAACHRDHPGTINHNAILFDLEAREVLAKLRSKP